MYNMKYYIIFYLDNSEEEEKPDFDQHLTWLIPEGKLYYGTLSQEKQGSIF